MDFLKPRSHRMNRRRRIYEGKAKVLYEGPEPGTLIQHFKDDATAFNAKKHEVIEGKGVLNNRISEYIFQRLNDIGVPTHFIRRINMREQLIREVEIIPLEVVVRNVAAGSLATRLGLEEGAQLPRSIIEFYYKNDQLNDPMVSEEHITAFGWAAPQEIDDIMALAIRVNDFLTGLFLGVGIRLVDFKIECGRLWEGDNMRIVLADEISPEFLSAMGRQDERQARQRSLPQGSGRYDRGLYRGRSASRRRAGERGFARRGPAARPVRPVSPGGRRATRKRAPGRLPGQSGLRPGKATASGKLKGKLSPGRSKGVVAGFARPNAQSAFNLGDEDLSVADEARARGRTPSTSTTSSTRPSLTATSILIFGMKLTIYSAPR